MRTRWRDLLYGLRLLWKNPGFTSVAVLALALGIGANTAIFSVVYATLLAPLPYRQPDRIVIVWSKIKGDRNGVSAGDYLDWKRGSTSFESMAAWTGDRKSTRLNSSHQIISYAVFCLKKKKIIMSVMQNSTRLYAINIGKGGLEAH